MSDHPDDATAELADRLHSAAIRLLRRLRQEDAHAGVSGPGLSALSVLAFNDGLTPTALAHIEQVSLPTVSRALKELDAQDLIERRVDPEDRRSQRLHVTDAGRARFAEGRARRVDRLARALDTLSPEDRDTLARAVRVLAGLGPV